MSIFKGRFLSLRVLTVSMLMLSVACTSPDENNPTPGSDESFQENQANFEFRQSVTATLDTSVEQKKVSMSKRGQILGIWGYPEKITYEVKACLRNKRTQNNLHKNKEFIIVNKFGSSISKQTKKDGCLYWREKFDFNYFKDAENIQIDRVIRGTGVYGGERPISLSLNPWVKRDKGVGHASADLLLPDKNIPASSLVKVNTFDDQFKAFAGDERKELQLDNFSFSLRQRGKKTANNFFLEIKGGKFYVNKKNVNGVSAKSELKGRGLYAVHARIVELYENSGEYKVLDNDATAKVNMLAVGFSKREIGFLKKMKRYKDFEFHSAPKGEFRMSLPKVIEHNWTEGGAAAVVLRVVPLETKSLSRLEGVYTGQSIKAMRTGSISVDRTDTNLQHKKTANYKAIIDNKETILNETIAKGEFEAYYYTEMSPRFMEVMKGETSTARTVKYNVKLCMSSRTTFSSAPIGKKFNITIKNVTSEETEVHENVSVKDKNGCITWLGELYHKVYLPEKYYFFDIKVEESDTKITHAKPRGYAINPWGDNLVFSEDRNSLDQDYIDSINQKLAISGRFVIPDFTYHTLRFRYEIDDYLNLKIKKSVLMRAHPKRLNYNSRTHGRQSVHPLRDGVYLMKLAMDKYYLDPSKQDHRILIKREAGDVEKATSYVYDAETNERLIMDSSREDKGFVDDKTLRFVGEDSGKPYDLKKQRHLTVDKKLIRIRHGELITPFEFVISDLRMMRVRSQIVMQVDTVNEQALWLVNLYDNFYSDMLKQLDAKYKSESDVHKKSGVYYSRDSRRDIMFKKRRQSFIEEKAKNLNKIAAKMREDERFIDYYLKCKADGYNSECDSDNPRAAIKERLKQCKSDNKKRKKLGQNPISCKPVHPRYKYKGEDYKICSDEMKVTMSDLARKFNLKQPLLDSELPNSFALFESNPANIKKLTRLSPTNDEKGGKCVRPFNILRKLVINDPIENEIAPIDGFDIEKLVDSTSIDEEDLADKKEGIPREAFTGPVTFVLNGNGSSMRTTRNLTENFCPNSQDCSQGDNEEVLALSLDEMAHGQDVAVTNGYDQSKYYGSIKYLNNKLVDDLIKDKEIMEKIEDRKNEVESLVHYFLKSQNLKLYSLAEQDQELKEVDQQKCPMIYKIDRIPEERFSIYSDKFTMSQIDSCISTNNSQLLPETGYFAKKVKDEEVSQYLDKLYRDEDEKGEKLPTQEQYKMEPRGLAYALCSEVAARNFGGRKRGGYGSVFGPKAGFIKQCLRQLKNGDKQGALSLERKIRVTKVLRNSYYYRAGKNMNLQVSSNMGKGTSHSISNSWGGGVGKSVGPFKIGFDRKESWSQSETEGISVSEGTYLVMQDSKMDVTLDRYIPCLIALPDWTNNNFLKGLRAKAKIELSQAERRDERLITERMIKMRNGVMLCGKETDQDLVIREGYYYFTQHFTEGDMQDTGDLFNHPWMVQIRGKADMWQFVTSVRGQMEKKYMPKDTWSDFIIDPIIGEKVKIPINLLIDAYQHVTPTFPRMFTMIHTEYPQDFPWGEQPKDLAKKTNELDLLEFVKNHGDEFLKEESEAAYTVLKNTCPGTVARGLKYVGNPKFPDCKGQPRTEIEETDILNRTRKTIGKAKERIQSTIDDVRPRWSNQDDISKSPDVLGLERKDYNSM